MTWICRAGFVDLWQTLILSGPPSYFNALLAAFLKFLLIFKQGLHVFNLHCVHAHVSYVWFFVTLSTVACQVSLSWGFSRQEYWSRLPCPPPGDLPNPGTEPVSLMSSALAGGFFTTSATWEACTPPIEGQRDIRRGGDYNFLDQKGSE